MRHACSERRRNKPSLLPRFGPGKLTHEQLCLVGPTSSDLNACHDHSCPAPWATNSGHLRSFLLFAAVRATPSSTEAPRLADPSLRRVLTIVASMASWARGGTKKREILGPHRSGSHRSGPHPSGPHPSGPHPSGPQPSGPPPCGGSTLGGRPKRPKSNWPKWKLAEVDRTRQMSCHEKRGSVDSGFSEDARRGLRGVRVGEASTLDELLFRPMEGRDVIPKMESRSESGWQQEKGHVTANQKSSSPEL